MVQKNRFRKNSSTPKKRFNKREGQKDFTSGKKADKQENSDSSDLQRLNKFISNSGVCSRREADTLIGEGKVKVNGKVVKEMGTKVSFRDKIEYGGKVLSGERKVYLLLNKPKDHITTMEDTHGRKTVMNLVGNACKERIYPVGRLDRNTTGLLLFTNDGELTENLTHPRYQVKKTYHATLDKGFDEKHLEEMRKGLDLEDGKAFVDVVDYIDNGGKKEVGVELHSGKNRIVRRMFEHLGYEVVKLDRIYYAGLTKKDLPRGRWRFLNRKEAGMLMMASKKK